MRTEELIKIKPYVSSKVLDKIEHGMRGIDCVLPDYNKILENSKSRNTTLIVKNIIELLFEKKIVLVIDHWYPESKEASIILLDKVILVLKLEHGIFFKNIKFDLYKHTIQLINL